MSAVSSAALAEQVRACLPYTGGGAPPYKGLLADALAALDRLVAEVDSERQAREKAEQELSDQRHDWNLYVESVNTTSAAMNAAISAAYDRAEAAEQRAAEQEKALREIAEPGCDHCVPPDSCLVGGYEDRCPACIAEAAARTGN